MLCIITFYCLPLWSAFHNILTAVLSYLHSDQSVKCWITIFLPSSYLCQKQTEIPLLNSQYYKRFSETHQEPETSKSAQVVFWASNSKQCLFILQLSSHNLKSAHTISIIWKINILRGKKCRQQPLLILRTQSFHLLIMLSLGLPNRNYCQTSQTQRKRVASISVQKIIPEKSWRQIAFFSPSN